MKLAKTNLLGQSVKFFAVGVLNTLVTWGVAVAIEQWVAWPAVAANAIGYAAGLANSYWWNSRWTFRSGPARPLTFFAVTGVVFVIQLAALLVFNDLGVDPVWAQGASVGVGAIASFFLHRALTFRRSASETRLMKILNSRNQDTDRDWVVGALVYNRRGQFYFHRRTFERKLFPGCWDVVGGHVEAGETVLEALGREIREETGWELKQVKELILELDWSSETPQGTELKHEFVFIVEVDGDLEHPVLEAGKHDKFAWVSHDTFDVLKENRQPDGQFILDLAERGFAWLKQTRRAD
jgi:putative flippase GtrA/8-oxo-dGTP pyrophosphatase MutT (NUDIX family)